jgi:hypothetical protein
MGYLKLEASYSKAYIRLDNNLQIWNDIYSFVGLAILKKHLSLSFFYFLCMKNSLKQIQLFNQG